MYAKKRIKNLEQSLQLSCLLASGMPGGANLCIEIERDMGLTIKVIADPIHYLVYKCFFDKVKKILDSSEELKINVNCDCKRYQDARTYIYNEGSFPIEKPVKSHQFSTSPATIAHGVEYYKNSIDMSSVEKDILPVVNALNSLKGVCTMSGCEGHRWWIMPPMYPFISFHASFAKVKDIAKMIYGLNLNYGWAIKGHISNGCPQTSMHIIWELSPQRFWYFRWKLRKDIHQIKQAIML